MRAVRLLLICKHFPKARVTRQGIDRRPLRLALNERADIVEKRRFQPVALGIDPIEHRVAVTGKKYSCPRYGAVRFHYTGTASNVDRRIKERN